MIQAVVFDLGEVLSSPPSLLPEIARRLGLEQELLKEHYWMGRVAYDSGSPDADYWGPLLDAVGVAANDDLIAELAQLDADIWSNLRPAAWQLLRDCRAAGVTVAVLSNSPRAMQKAADTAAWRADVDHLYVSATVGAIKPEPEIYAHVQRDLQLPPEQIAFIDDKPANVDAARAAGWHGHVWVDDDDTRAWLERLDVLPAR